MNLEAVTEDRIGEIRNLIHHFMTEDSKAQSAEFQTYVKENLEKEVRSLQEVLTPLYAEAIEAQKEDSLEEVQYVRIFPRRTTILEGDYGFIIRVYDYHGYECQTEISREWTPEFISQFYEKLLEKAAKRVKMKLFRMTPREEQLVKFIFMEFFNFYVLSYLGILADAFIYVEPMVDLELEKMMAVTFGDYLEEGTVIKLFSKV